MADKRDYYEVLGVDKNANDDTIKKAYLCHSNTKSLKKEPYYE